MVKTIEQEMVFSTHNFDEVFPIIDPSEIIGHKLLEHKPKTANQDYLMYYICKGIDLKLSAFRAPCMDPSEEDGKIVFKPGNKPAVGHSAVWWNETWRQFMPSKNSRSGTDLHWAAFLGKQMKYLIEEENYSVEDAWKAVCDDSRDLGHYRNSKDAKHDLEPTGSRKSGVFFDLANTSKVLDRGEKKSECWLAGGSYKYYSYRYPLSSLDSINKLDEYYDSVGWLVMDV